MIPNQRTPGGAGSRRLGRGLSLIEALVAFAVMGFGMLGVLGIQATLRGNADLAKQRTEAVRIAQEALESWRAFSVLNTTPTHLRVYADINDRGPSSVTGYTTNTTYTLSGIVTEDVAGGAKTVVVDVAWADRNGITQSVRLASLIAGVAPGLAASVGTPGAAGPSLSPAARSSNIPVGAVDFGNGQSGFIPPQPEGPGPSVAWLFDNVTGLFAVCEAAAAVLPSVPPASQFVNCGTQLHLLVQGYLRYATQAAPPGPTAADVADAAAVGPLFPQPQLAVVQSLPASLAATRGCLVSRTGSATFGEYYCAVPVDPAIGGFWTGSVAFADNPASSPPFLLASGAADTRADRFRICRYFAAASYANVTAALFDQNYAIVLAGSGTQAFACPSPPTWTHQPTTP